VWPRPTSRRMRFVAGVPLHNAIVGRLMRASGISSNRLTGAARGGLSQSARILSARAGLVGLLTMAMLAVSGTTASALIVNLPGRAVSYEPVKGGAGAVKGGAGAVKRSSAKKPPVKGTPVEYHGGPVMSSNTNYALYWDPTGGPEYPAGYESGLNRYFEDLAHDSGGAQNIDSVLTQYNDEAGEFANYNSHFGGALIDSDPYPASGFSAAPVCFTDEQLRAEIKSYVEAHKLPTDLQHEYFMLTPPGVESCLEVAGRSCSDGTKHAAYCAYHSFISTASGVVIYANDPYVDGLNCDYGEEHPNNNASDATIGGGVAHEHSESVTDPELNAWYDSKKLEVADKCRTFIEATEYGAALGKAPDGSKYNQVINGDLYYYQQAWSNEARACEQRRPAPLPTVSKVTPKRGSASGGTTVTVSGTDFTSPATVKFGEAAGTKVTVNSSTSITVVSPAHAAGTVDVIVTTSAGSSAASKKDHFIYKK
jgi:hypothetical protein